MDIIVQDTLLNYEGTRGMNSDIKKLFFEFKKLSEKDLKLQLHIITL